MSRATLRWIPEAARWEALPSTSDVRILDVRILDDHLRLLLGATGPVGFVIDLDEDLGSHIDLLARWVEVDSWRDVLGDPAGAVDGVEIEVTATERSSVVARASVAVPATRPVAVPSRRISVAPVDRGVRVSITARWWLALWGMWFTVVRGDGLVLADLPVRRRLAVEVVPNAVPVRPGDVRGVLRRGPTTVRRVTVAVLAGLAIVVTLVTLTIRESGTAAPLVSVAPSETISTATVPSSADSDSTGSVDTVGPPSESAPPSVSSPGPGGPTPDGTRRPATDFVTADGVIGADARVVEPDGSLTPGGTFSVEVSLDWSAVNLFGGVDGRGDPVESMNSCRAVLDFFRTTPTIPGPTLMVRVLLAPVAGGEAVLVSENPRDLSLVGAMAEECPEADPASTDPYRIRQRTFYEPFVVESRVPDTLGVGDYSLVVEIAGVVWGASGGPTVEVS